MSSSTESSARDICSICVEQMHPKMKRSLATLACDHKFHLDCIGSHFNYSQGAMICPNCRFEEEGDWRIPEYNDDQENVEDDEEIFPDLNINPDIDMEEDDYEEGDDYEGAEDAYLEMVHHFMLNGWPDQLNAPRVTMQDSVDQFRQNRNWAPQPQQMAPAYNYMSSQPTLASPLARQSPEWIELLNATRNAVQGHPTFPNQLGMGAHAGHFEPYPMRRNNRIVVENVRLGQPQHAVAVETLPLFPQDPSWPQNPFTQTRNILNAGQNRQAGYGRHTPGRGWPLSQQTANGYSNNLLPEHQPLPNNQINPQDRHFL